MNIIFPVLIIATLLTATAQAATQQIVVAGGCFWCVESDFENYPGVINAVSGYAGGTVQNPSYKQVARGGTGHYEVVRITYDDSKVSLQNLLDYFWLTIDPTDPHGQFCDKGGPYKTAIFYGDEAERKVAQSSLNKIKQEKPFQAEIVTPLLPAATFWPAEKYHQDYARKNPIRYKYYRTGCGRDNRIKALWGDVASKKKR